MQIALRYPTVTCPGCKRPMTPSPPVAVSDDTDLCDLTYACKKCGATTTRTIKLTSNKVVQGGGKRQIERKEIAAKLALQNEQYYRRLYEGVVKTHRRLIEFATPDQGRRQQSLWASRRNPHLGRLSPRFAGLASRSIFAGTKSILIMPKCTYAASSTAHRRPIKSLVVSYAGSGGSNASSGRSRRSSSPRNVARHSAAAASTRWWRSSGRRRPYPSNSPTHAAPRDRLQARERRRQYWHHSKVSRPSQHSAHGALHRAVGEAVQKFVGRLAGRNNVDTRSLQE